MLTEKGQTLRGILRSRMAAEEERATREANEAAQRWAEERVSWLSQQCEQTKFGTTIEIVGLANRRPSAEETMRIAALEAALGVTFDPDDIHSGMFAGQGGSDFAISMELTQFLGFLEASSAPS